MRRSTDHVTRRALLALVLAACGGEVAAELATVGLSVDASLPVGDAATDGQVAPDARALDGGPITDGGPTADVVEAGDPPNMCINNLCQDDSGSCEACDASAQCCQGNHCYRGKCVGCSPPGSPCAPYVDTDCCWGAWCGGDIGNQGRCEPSKGPGLRCAYDRKCLSNYCALPDGGHATRGTPNGVCR